MNIEKDDTGEIKHSLFGGSNAHRWSGEDGCPGSVSLSAGLPKLPSSDYADEGTLAHEIARLELEGYPNVSGIREHIITSEMVSGAVGWRSYIEKTALHGSTFGMTIRNSNLDDGKTKRYVSGVEKRVKYPVWGGSRESLRKNVKNRQFPDWVGDGYGSGIVDCYVIDRRKKRAYIFDYKFGAGVRVEAQDNLQLLTYAAGVAWTHSQIEIDDFSVHIYQPRLDHVSTVTYARDDVLAHQRRIFNAFVETVKVDPVFNPTAKNCKWCPAARVCEPAAQRVLDLVSATEKEKIENTVFGPAVRRLMKSKKFIYGHLAELEKQGIATIEIGGEIEGFHVGRKRGRSVITEEGENKIVRKLGKRKSYVKKLRTLTEFRKLLPQEFIIKCIETIPGSKTLKFDEESHGKGDGYFGEKVDFDDDDKLAF